MHINFCKEQFSRAWVHAVASVAGFSIYEPVVDDDSIDLGFAKKGSGGSYKAPRIECQLKCTGNTPISGGVIKFPLKLKNYNDLRSSNLLVPRILIVIRIPEDLDESLEQMDDELILKHCGHWVSLRGSPASKNEASETVCIPLENRFDVKALQNMMGLIEKFGFIKEINDEI